MFKQLSFKWSSALFLILFLISAGFTAFITSRFYRVISTIQATERTKAKQETANAATELTRYILNLQPMVDSLAKTLSEKKLSPQQIEEKLKQKPISVSGFGVAFLPEASPTKKLNAPYFVEQENEQKFINLADLYDYTEEDQKWFNNPLKLGARFNDPYFGKTSKSILAEYAAPFYYTDENGNKKPAGIVFANQSVIHLQHFLNTLFLGPSGYWFILAPNGSFLVHPQQERVSGQQTLADLASERKDSGLKKAAEEIQEQKSVFLEYRNEVTDTKSWLVCDPIKATSWSICGVFDQQELPVDQNSIRQQLMIISLSLLLSLIFLVFFIASLFPLVPAKWWTTSLICSVLLAFEIVILWYFASMYPHFRKNLQEINNKTSLYSYLVDKGTKEKETREEQIDIEEKKHQEFEKQLTFDYNKATLIPTGIFITHLQFVTEKQVEFVGYIWQRYLDSVHDKVNKGFILPQAVKSTITELSRSKLNNTETIIWRVEATLNQRFLYSRYPFDIKNIQIQLWHADFEKQTILIPDLESYTLLNPHALPGLSPHIQLAGWIIEESYFGYKTNPYTTVFGMYVKGPFGTFKQLNKSAIPELYYNVSAKRKLIDTLIGDLLPLFVVALILFTILLTSVMQGYGVFASCAAVFFGLVFAQFRFRGKIPSYQLVYFEHLFFVLFTAIIAILIVSILHLYNFNIGFIQYRRNMIAKLLFWPILLTWLIGITVWYLY